jgi:hypothetical protein
VYYAVFRFGVFGPIMTVKADHPAHAIQIVCDRLGLQYAFYHHQFWALRAYVKR